MSGEKSRRGYIIDVISDPEFPDSDLIYHLLTRLRYRGKNRTHNRDCELCGMGLPIRYYVKHMIRHILDDTMVVEEEK